MEILYEDNHLLCVVKPINMPVQEDSSGDPDLLNHLKAYIKEEYNKPGNVYLGLVHRLDRPVGGAIVFAKTSKAASRLAKELQKKAMKRKYLAVVHGQTEAGPQKLTHYLYKDRKTNTSRPVSANHPQAKKAILTYQRLASNEKYSLLEVELETGRSHQIRVQLAAIGHPLYGDQKYGVAVNQVGQQLALWANKLEFKHPTRDLMIKVQAEIPQHQPWTNFKINL